MNKQAGFTHLVIAILISVMAVGLVAAAWYYEENKDNTANTTTVKTTNDSSVVKPYDKITSYEECIAAGHSTTYGFPKMCPAMLRHFSENTNIRIKTHNETIINDIEGNYNVGIQYGYDKIDKGEWGSMVYVIPLNNPENYLEIPEEQLTLNTLRNNISQNNITYLQNPDEYLSLTKRSQYKLIQRSINDGSILNTVTIKMSEVKSRIEELPSDMFQFSNLDNSSVQIYNPQTLSVNSYELTQNIQSTFWDGLYNYILYTTDTLNEETNSNIYIYNKKLQTSAPLSISGAESLRYTFNAYKKYNYSCSKYGQPPQNRIFSPDGKQIALDNILDCKGLAIINSLDATAQVIFSDTTVTALGWISNEKILLRIKNQNGDYRIVSYSLVNKVEERLIEENMYWDVQWVISPNKKYTLYVALSTLPEENVKPCGESSTCEINKQETDIYLVNNITGDRNLLFSNYPISYNNKQILLWSNDSKYYAIRTILDDDDYNNITQCTIHDLSGNIINTIFPCSNIIWL